MTAHIAVAACTALSIVSMIDKPRLIYRGDSCGLFAGQDYMAENMAIVFSAFSLGPIC